MKTATSTAERGEDHHALLSCTGCIRVISMLIENPFKGWVTLWLSMVVFHVSCH